MKSKREYQTRNRNSGFTLVEVLLVLGIIIVIMALVVPNFLGSQQDAMNKACRVKIKGVEDVAKLYAVSNNGFYPKGTHEDIYEMFIMPVDPETGRERPGFMDDFPYDPWGNVIRYEYPPTGNHQVRGDKPAIWSPGPDGDDDTEDDVTNFISEQRL